LNAPQGSLYAVADALRQHVGPLVHRLVGHTYSSGYSRNRAAQQLDGLYLEHGLLNHSSETYATTVQPPPHTVQIVEYSDDYQGRFARAMAEAGLGVGAVADGIGVTYQANVRAACGFFHASR